MNLKEIEEEMKELKDWSLESGMIVKYYEFSDFKEALKFVDKIGEIAEKHNHHPDIIISNNQVKLSLTTHSYGGLTKIDFVVAKEIDSLS